MSTWNLGYGDVSEELQGVRNQMASKESQIAAHQTQLLRQRAELDELKRTLNEAIYKLSHETERALKLEDDLAQRNHELQNEKIACQNVQTALSAAHETIKAADLGARELEATLESLSQTSDSHRSRCLHLEREKSTLEACVRELQSQAQLPPTLPKKPSERSRPRSSSLSNFKMTTLEQELADTRSSLRQKEKEVQDVERKFASAQNEAIKLGNEKQAMEKRTTTRIHELQSSLDEKEEELDYLRQQEGDSSREQALLQRIEEDGAKITALESMLHNIQEVKNLENPLKNSEVQLLKEQNNPRTLETVSEWNGNESSTSSVPPPEDNYRDMPCDPDGHEGTLAYIERLLSAIDRLRGERDSLRRDVQFLESESRFAIEALEAKLSFSMAAPSESDDTVATVGQMKAEMDVMHAQLSEHIIHHNDTILAKQQEIKKLGLNVTAMAVVIDRLNAQIEEMELDSGDARLKESEDKLDATVLCLKAMTSQRDDLMAELKNKEKYWEMDVQKVRASQHETMEYLKELSCQVHDLTRSLDEVESERNSLAVQVANLETDLQNAHDELKNAESRYSSLQFHQLSTMSSNEATEALREQIEELEMRVIRRNEQVGMHQHDIRRLETNLRLQEERLSEMTMEMEMLSAQKSAMVEDCADAREVRDDALKRVETLEDEVENLEAILEHETETVATLIHVVIENVAKRIDTVRSANRLQASLPSAEALVQSNQLFAAAQDDLKRAKLSYDILHQEKTQLDLDVSTLRVQLKDLDTQIHSLRSEHSLVVVEYNKRKADFESRSQELLAQIDVLETSKDELKLSHLTALNSLENEIIRLNQCLKERDASTNHFIEETEMIRQNRNEGIQELESRLADVTKTLADVQVRNKSEALQFQEQLRAARSESDSVELQLRELQQSRSAAEDIHRNELLRLQDLLSKESQNAQQLEKSFKVLENEKSTLLLDISSIEEELQTTHHELENQKSLLEATIQRSEVASREVDCLTNLLEDERGLRCRDREEHTTALLSLRAHNEQGGATIRQLEAKLADLQTTFEQVDGLRSASEREKLCLQEEVTSLVSEVQRKKSLQRSLENQLQESEQAAGFLKSEIARIEAALAKSEQLNSKATVNISLLTAQHKREMTDIQRDLQALRSRPNLDHLVLELEDRNEEMEELLRKKCTEIEGNDDRALEMLKENKKLNSKVESLTRKVQALQTKITTLKSSIPKGGENSNPQTDGDVAPTVRARSATISSIHPPPRSSTPSSTNSRLVPNRVVSGPSLPRPKTPERPPVFKACTPEKSEVSQNPETPSSVIGKKRRVPDDFEACDGLPPQTFTADSLPGDDIENRTPRVRRVLSSLQSGFTPVRHLGRPLAPMHSPRRNPPSSQNSPFISDLANSPLVIPPLHNLAQPAKSSKRSWLGKIRGVSTQAMTRSSRPVTD